MSGRARTVAARSAVPVALMALIFYLSAQPSVGPDLPAFTRVIAHFTEYAVLATLWVWALAPALGRRAFLAAGAISFLYAVSDEWHQSFVEGRDSDPLDVLGDAAGITVALVLLRAQARGTASTRRTQSASRG